MRRKDEPVEEVCSQLGIQSPSHPQLNPSLRSILLRQGLHTPQQLVRTHSVRKRSLGQAFDMPLQAERPTTYRGLFTDNKEQAQSSAAPLQADCSKISASQQLQAQGARSPLGEANMEHDPINAIPVSHHMPQHGQRDHPESNRLTATWSQLPAHSAQVLHARLSACALLPEHTATGQQLLEIELQIQSILGVRKAERGEDADNVCWVDNGLLLCPEGVKSFAIAYGDAECAQVFTLLHAQMPNTQE